MRRVGLVAMAALAACRSVPAPESPVKSTRTTHWGVSPESAHRIACLDRALALSESPELIGVMGEAERYLAECRAGVALDAAVSRIAQARGFDCVVEKDGSGRPDLTFHVIREFMGTRGGDRVSLIEQLKAVEEQRWELLAIAAERLGKLRSAEQEISRLQTECEKLSKSILAEQAKTQQAEANLAAATRDLQGRIEALQGAAADTRKNNEALAAELATAQARAAKLEQELAAARAQEAASSAGAQEANKRLAESQAVRAELDKQVQAAAAARVQLEQRAAALTQQVNELSGANAAHTENLQRLTKEKGELERQAAQSRAAREEAETRLAAEKTRTQALEQSRQALESRVQAVEAERQSRLAQLHKDSAELTAQVASIQEELKKFTAEKPDDAQLGAIRNQIVELEVRVKVLSGELSNLDPKASDQIKTLAEAVGTLKQKLALFAR